MKYFYLKKYYTSCFHCIKKYYKGARNTLGSCCKNYINGFSADSSGILILEKLILNPRARHWEKTG